MVDSDLATAKMAGCLDSCSLVEDGGELARHSCKVMR